MTEATVRLQRLRCEQNLMGGVLAGAVASVVGAATWAVITVATGYQIGWMAVGVGFLVGFALRSVGRGVDRIFGISGATLAVAGCVVGNLLAVCGLVAQHEGMAFLDVVAQLDMSLATTLMVESFSPMDLLFYGIAIYEGYHLSFRAPELPEADLEGELLESR